MTAQTVSAVIITRNEERNIVDALATLQFADQIVVADTGSTDKTIEYAKRQGAEVHNIRFDGYGAAKNKALEFCKCEWVLFIDADERISTQLAREIKDTLQSGNNFDGYEICRLSYFLEKPIKHSGWFPDYVLRLFKNGKGKYNERLVHENLNVIGHIGRLKGLIYHHSYLTLEQYLEKMNLYSTLNAEEMCNSGKKYRFADLIFRPPATFLRMYIVQAGYLDGMRGFVLAILSSFHVFTKYAKLRGLSKKRLNEQS
jgi:glycosyltransferase involved in cell wall biosynthesis